MDDGGAWAGVRRPESPAGGRGPVPGGNGKDRVPGLTGSRGWATKNSGVGGPVEQDGALPEHQKGDENGSGRRDLGIGRFMNSTCRRGDAEGNDGTGGMERVVGIKNCAAPARAREMANATNSSFRNQARRSCAPAGKNDEADQDSPASRYRRTISAEFSGRGTTVSASP